MLSIKTKVNVLIAIHKCVRGQKCGRLEPSFPMHAHQLAISFYHCSLGVIPSPTPRLLHAFRMKGIG